MTNTYSNLTIDQLRKEVRQNVSRLVGLFQNNEDDYSTCFRMNTDSIDIYGYDSNQKLLFRFSKSLIKPWLWLKFHYKNEDHNISLVDYIEIDRKRAEIALELFTKMVDEYWNIEYEKRNTR